MSSETILYITIAAITALLLALFQYVYKFKVKSKLSYILAALRAISIFCILLLLINPKFEALTYFEEKPTLVVAVDNSESISYLNQKERANQTLQNLKHNSELSKHFAIETYSFGESVRNLERLSFNESQSNISKAIQQFSDVYANRTAPIVLITDGNQTYGEDYSYASKGIEQPIYSVILGDSIRYLDLSIKQLNVNRYVYLKNKFPVEVIANYNGSATVNTELKIWSGNTVVYRKSIQFNSNKTSEVISTTLSANSVGVKTYSVELVALNNEKNSVNNSKNFAVEVIDEKTNIALVSDMLHPDLGAIKKAIESNEQRTVSILKPKEFLSKINDFQLVILYQPNTNFKEILKDIKKLNLNTFTITGTATNWNLLNASQNYYKQTITNQSERFLASFNTNYNTFICDQINFSNLPPLKSQFGAFNFSTPNSVMLYKTVNGINTAEVLLATFEVNLSKHAVLNGEGIWRWRAQSYIETGNFIAFDIFINKLVQYLSSNKKRKRITIDYKSFYNGNDDIVLTAHYFNKNFEFDNSATLTAVLKNKTDNSTKEVPLLLNNGNYKVDLSGIASGFYDFTIKDQTNTVSISGRFQVLDYNVEHQFLNADLDKLKAVSKSTNGKAYFSTQIDELVEELINNKRYVTLQKSNKNIVSLIDLKYLLSIIAFSLFAEWFIRKYNGLI
ncbi:MAG: VWA domain-containing protein [Winogradskyella sp.]